MHRGRYLDCYKEKLIFSWKKDEGRNKAEGLFQDSSGRSAISQINRHGPIRLRLSRLRQADKGVRGCKNSAEILSFWIVLSQKYLVGAPGAGFGALSIYNGLLQDFSWLKCTVFSHWIHKWHRSFWCNSWNWPSGHGWRTILHRHNDFSFGVSALQANCLSRFEAWKHDDWQKWLSLFNWFGNS